MTIIGPDARDCTISHFSTAQQRIDYPVVVFILSATVSVHSAGQ